MTDAEVLAFLDEERVMTCATFGPSGWPHLMPLWYVLRDGRLWAWTFAKSQKTKNLERDPRATLQVEAGHDQYPELRGVMIEAQATIHRDADLVTDLGLEIFGRYGGDATGQVAPEVREMVKAQAGKRVGLEFAERSRATWDHRKLGGTY
ncbi:MAG: pyridoxamine 5-phosphate oxidase [Conexibacter sp.]|nr:pyridoxamine 5-phosphate oxidase [Conexibacter sp.]